ncbi:MAG: S9 family peptidase, partial [Opitutaceae bacterium]
MRVISAVLLMSLCSSSATLAAAPSGPWAYPPSKAGSVVDDYHGTRVPDPYRWLEELDSAETTAWVAAQNRLTQGFLGSLPGVAAFRERLTKLWNYPRAGVPFREGGRTFFTRNSGLQNQSVLYVQDRPDATPRVLIDPNTLAADGTVALTSVNVSRDGRLLAYGTAAAGS